MLLFGYIFIFILLHVCLYLSLGPLGVFCHGFSSLSEALLVCWSTSIHSLSFYFCIPCVLGVVWFCMFFSFMLLGSTLWWHVFLFFLAWFSLFFWIPGYLTHLRDIIQVQMCTIQSWISVYLGIVWLLIQHINIGIAFFIKKFFLW